jgi:cyclomaltodextrin glucanotransferase
MLAALHLTDGTYRNPYELMSFYDNHDMQRLAANEDGFVDANHWLFTARGIPVVYYGSEIAFMAGTKEHEGNRNYFGRDNVARARTHRIRAALAKIAAIRRESPALQRGLQVNLELKGDRAAFLRVYERPDRVQTALVLLNKGDQPARFSIDRWLSSGEWREAGADAVHAVTLGKPLALHVPAHGARVLLHEGRTEDAGLRAELDRAMAAVAGSLLGETDSGR